MMQERILSRHGLAVTASASRRGTCAEVLGFWIFSLSGILSAPCIYL